MKQTIHNIKGCILRPLGKLTEDFKVKGLLLPKDEVSRNGVLYDWESVKSKAKEFEGVPMNFNHIIDDNEKPVGKIERTWIKEEDDDEGKAGMYYEARIDEESQYANSIKKGFLDKVSIQVTADAQKEEAMENGDSYTRAWIGSPLEVSVVKVPGFNQTTMEVALAEAFKINKKEGIKVICERPDGTQVTKIFDNDNSLNKFINNNKHLIVVKRINERVKEEEDSPLITPDGAKIAEELQEESIFNYYKFVKVKYPNKINDNTLQMWFGRKYFDSKSRKDLLDEFLSEIKKHNKEAIKHLWQYSKDAIDDNLDKYDGVKESIQEDHIDKGIFPMDEFHKGLEQEQSEHPEVGPIETAQLVLDHLKEDEYYYSNDKEQMSTANVVTATKIPKKKKEFKVVDIVEILSDEELEELVNELQEVECKK